MREVRTCVVSAPYGFLIGGCRLRSRALIALAALGGRRVVSPEVPQRVWVRATYNWFEIPQSLCLDFLPSLWLFSRKAISSPLILCLLALLPASPTRKAEMDQDQDVSDDWSTFWPFPDLSLDQWDSLNIDLDLDTFIDSEAPLLLEQGIDTVFSNSPLGFPGSPLLAPVSPSNTQLAEDWLHSFPADTDRSTSKERPKRSFDAFSNEALITDRGAAMYPFSSFTSPSEAVSVPNQALDSEIIAGSPPNTQCGVFITFSLNNRPVRAYKRRRASDKRCQEIREMRVIGSCLPCRKNKRSVRLCVCFANNLMFGFVIC
jgi:hypothetical protein